MKSGMLACMKSALKFDRRGGWRRVFSDQEKKAKLGRKLRRRRRLPASQRESTLCSFRFMLFTWTQLRPVH